MGGLFVFISSASHMYGLGSIKSKTVGDGQHGTARWATKSEVEYTYTRVNYEPQKWREDEKSRPKMQGIVVGCESVGHNKTIGLVDTGDVHCMMIGAAGVGKTAYWLYPNIEYACASGMSFMTTDTLNGIAYRSVINGTQKISFDVEISQPFLSVRSNDGCFALMKEKFSPFVVFSCIGTFDMSGNLIAPAKIEYQKLTDKRYRISFMSTSPLGYSILFEANLYENKLFQDTTVESKNISANNAFGGVGFIGNTAIYGEQWLYSRLDYTRLPEIMDKRIGTVTFYMPNYNQNDVELKAFKVATRFCSFGSNWSNKISGDVAFAESNSINGYQSIDLTPLLVDKNTRTISRSEGLILKSKVRDSGFSAIATGDSYYAPQILEVNFR